MTTATEQPAIKAPTHLTCNTCNHVRAAGVHPCPKYRIEAEPETVPASSKNAPDVVFRGDELAIHFDQFDLPAYDLFLKAKALPEYRISFDDRDETYTITAPARFAAMLGVERPESGLGDLPLSDFLLDDQRAIVPLALDAKRFAVWSTCGLGKALRADEPVLTPSGWKPIGSLSVGDEVVGSDGRPHNVTGVYSQGIRDLYRVRFTDGVEVVCDGEHLWLVQTQAHRFTSRVGRVLTTLQIIDEGLADGLNRKRHFVPLVCPIENPPADLPIDPYTLGVLIGDGSLKGVPSLTTADPEILDFLILPGEVTAKKVDNQGKRCPSYNLSTPRGQSNPLTDTIRKLGLWGHRAWEKFIPTVYLRGSAEQRRQLLSGLIDTDGSVCDGTIEFVTTSHQLALDVAELVQSLGGVAPIRTKQPVFLYKGELRLGRIAYRLNVKLPSGECPFRLIRKQNAWKPRTNRIVPPRAIKAIEPAGTGEAVCISVDAPDHLFVTRGHVLTHNTVIAFEWARQVVHRTAGRVLIVTMNDIVEVFLAERDKFYPDLPVLRIESQADLVRWCEHGEPGIAITNYEKFNPKGLTGGTINECRHLRGIILDESSRLKGGGDSVQKKVLNASCKGIEYKLSCTATPAPNQTIEFVSQAVFLETVRSENDIIWSHFVRDNKTHRRTVKPNARDGFFKFMATWSIYLKHPKRFGWRLDQPDVPEPTYFNYDLDSTPEQRALARDMLSDAMGGNLIVSRETNAIERVKLAEIARGFLYRGKGRHREIVRVPSAKPPFIADLANREVADGHQVLIWTVFDEEAALIREGLASSSVEVLTGKTKPAERKAILDRFRIGRTQILVSRPSMLGYGQNFQFCTSMIFSGFTDSFEELFQAIRRAVRYGQSQSVRVHFPIVRDLEEETFANLQRKASDYERDTSEMEENYVRAIEALNGVA